MTAQEADTTVWLEEMSVSARHLIGSEADSVNISVPRIGMSSLTDILRTESNIYFRDFGPGSSSTISMFGSKSNEVALIWNGIQVANPMLGVNDYSMISLADMTSLRVARVGSSTVYGAGSGAGAILMDQIIEEQDNPFAISAGWSSLHQFNGTTEYTKSDGKWKSRTSLGGQTGQNNFQFTSLSGNRERLPHAQSHFLTVSHHTEYHYQPHQHWALSIWARNQYREIPPLLTEPRSEADQSDAFIRTMIQYNDINPRHSFHLKAFYGFQNQHYQNPLIDLNAHHQFQNMQLRMDNEWQPYERVYIKYGLQDNYFSSQSDNYLKVHRQNRISSYSRIRYELSRIPLDIIFLAQPEWVSNQKTGWTTELKIKYQHDSFGHWMVFGNQNIVWPTLNDLYWNPGGNPDLKPEKNRMVGFSWKKNWPDNLRSSTTFYFRQAENWIQWLPTDLGFWRPVNAHEGRSYGVNLELKKRIGQHVETKAGYQFVRTYTSDEALFKAQTVYTPKHMWSFQWVYKIDGHWEVRLNGEFTSTRYVTRDHSVSLEPYFLCHSGITYQVNNHPCAIGLHLRNLFDAEYQGIRNRPMPGRQIEINTQIKF